MKKNKLSMLVVAAILVACFVCGCLINKIVLHPKDAVEPEEEVFDSFSQAGMNHLLSQEAVEYEDSVMHLYQAYLVRYSQYQDQIEEEHQLWKDYEEAACEAYRYVNMGGFCGSAAPMGFYSFGMDLVKQFLVSFEGCREEHMSISDKMIKAEYLRFLNFGIAEFSCEADKTDYTLAEKQEALRAEKKAWDRWMEKREALSALMDGESKARYDNCTNELKRMKLIQLKNQYQWYPIGSDEYFEQQLSPDCTDEELLRYTSFDRVWNEYKEELL